MKIKELLYEDAAAGATSAGAVAGFVSPMFARRLVRRRRYKVQKINFNTK